MFPLPTHTRCASERADVCQRHLIPFCCHACAHATAASDRLVVCRVHVHVSFLCKELCYIEKCACAFTCTPMFKQNLHSSLSFFLSLSLILSLILSLSLSRAPSCVRSLSITQTHTLSQKHSHTFLSSHTFFLVFSPSLSLSFSFSLSLSLKINIFFPARPYAPGNSGCRLFW